MSDVLGVLTVVTVGLMVGVEFSVAVFLNPILDRLPDDGGGLAARSDGARVLGRVMPVWYGGSVVLGAIWTATAWGGHVGTLVTTGVALLVVSVVMSLLLLVPIASRAATWSHESAPVDWKDQAHRWDRFHYVRVGVIVLAFVLFAAALS